MAMTSWVWPSTPGEIVGTDNQTLNLRTGAGRSCCDGLGVENAEWRLYHYPKA